MTLLLTTSLSQIDKLRADLTEQLSKIELEERKLFGLTLYQYLITSFSEKTLCKVKSYYEDDILSEPVIEISINGRHHHRLSSEMNQRFTANIFDNIGEAEFKFKNDEPGRLSMLQQFVSDEIEFKNWMAHVFNDKLEQALPVKNQTNKPTKV